MHAFVRDLITEWRRLGLPTEDGCVVVAVSGGADSVSLLTALDDMRKREKHSLRVVAAHFNHRLRGADSDADEQFVRRLTELNGIELAVGHGDIGAAGNLEQNARQARYAFLAATAENLGAIAVLTGHTINDQAETFLINLLRGSGIDGLSGMKVSRKLTDHSSNIELVRPLLKWARRGDTEQYCHDNGIQYRYDTMNEDTAFKRVRIRKILLPLLADFNPNIIETLANTAELMQRAAIGAVIAEPELPEELDIKYIKTLKNDDVGGVIRRWLNERRGTARGIGMKHIEAIQRLALSEKSGRKAELPGGQTVTRGGGKLRFEQN